MLNCRMDSFWCGSIAAQINPDDFVDNLLFYLLIFDFFKNDYATVPSGWQFTRGCGRKNYDWSVKLPRGRDEEVDSTETTR